MENLIKEYESLIWAIAQKFPYYKNKEDLFQVGCVGLIEAYKNFNKDLGTKFSSYAYFYILGKMKKLVREDKNIKISRDINKLNLRIEKVYYLLIQKLNRIPNTKEIAEAIDVAEELVVSALNARNVVQSMEEPINSDGKEITYHELIGDKKLDIDMLLDLKYQLNNLPNDEKELIYKRYLYNKTQSELAKELNTSQVQISRKEQKILSKLRSNLTHS